MALTIISINVNGLRAPSKRAGFLHWLHSLPSIPDIVCLQEAHCMSSEECSSWFSSSGLSFVVSPGSINSCGCIVLYRPVLVLLVLWLILVFSCPPSDLLFPFACSCFSPSCFFVLLCFYRLSCASHSKPAFVLD